MINIQIKFHNSEKQKDAYDVIESRFILWPYSTIRIYSSFLKIKVQTDIELNVVIGLINSFLPYIESVKWERVKDNGADARD